MARIELKNVTKRWGGYYAVEHLDLTIGDNAFVTLLGPSGCGKTTTLRMIAGLETPTEGRITIDGVPVFDSDQGINIPPNKRRVGFLFQNYALWPNMTVFQNISFGLSNINEPGVSVNENGEVIRDEKATGAARKLTKEEIKRSWTAIPASCPAASSSASPSPAPWPRAPACCSWTSPFQTSTPSCAWRCARSCSACT